MVKHEKKAIHLGVYTDFNIDGGASLIGTSIVSEGSRINRFHVVDTNYSIGSSFQVVQHFDNVAVANVTIFYANGAPSFTGNVSISQTQDGSVLLVPWDENNIKKDQALANLALGNTHIESITIHSISRNNQVALNLPADVLCFARGSNILTCNGEIPIEQLAIGDMIATKDNGMQAIRWIGSITVNATGDLAPVMIQKGAMGNARNLRVSPQHRMLIEGWKAELLFGKREVLVAAKYLVNQDTIYVSEGDTVEYFHILFDTHQIIFANGIPSESFHPGKSTIGAMTKETHAEIFNLFPKLRESPETYGPIVRTILKKNEAKVLSENPDFLSYKLDHRPTMNP